MTVIWRKSSRSAAESNCIELAWRKASRSASEANCVELTYTGLVRDSKNPTGPILTADLHTLLASVKSGRVAG